MQTLRSAKWVSATTLHLWEHETMANDYSKITYLRLHLMRIDLRHQYNKAETKEERAKIAKQLKAISKEMDKRKV